MATLVLRSVKGAPLTNAEVDANFSNLNADVATRAVGTGTVSGTNTGDQTTITGNAGSATTLSAGADRTKLNGIATGATANSTDAVLLARANHTGTQAAATITGLAAVATSGLKADVGLGNVDNTSDANKPVSTAQATAIALKTDPGNIQMQLATAVTTVGSSTAYSIATFPVQPSLVANQRYRIKLHTPNGAAPTLTRDGLAAVALKVYNSAGAKVSPAAATLPTLFDVEYDGTDYVVLNPLPPVSGGVPTFSAGTTGLTPNTATSGAITLAGTLAVANGGTGATTSTGSGAVVLATSPTLVTPALGTPTALIGTNITGTAAGLSIGGSAATVTTVTTAQVLTATAGASALAVGSYALGTPTTPSSNGTTYAGSGLNLSAGTWRCMGSLIVQAGCPVVYGSVFLRIA